MDYFSARNFSVLHASAPSDDITSAVSEGCKAWDYAPQLFGVRIIFDMPALLITLLITILVYRGINETRKAANAMVLVKIGIVLLVVVTGAFFVNTSNWDPFLPNGIPGLLKGISAVFFAYIGFDAISTTAEECRDPQRDLPRGILYSILICTILYA